MPHRLRFPGPDVSSFRSGCMKERTRYWVRDRAIPSRSRIGRERLSPLFCVTTPVLVSSASASMRSTAPFPRASSGYGTRRGGETCLESAVMDPAMSPSCKTARRPRRRGHDQCSRRGYPDSQGRVASPSGGVGSYRRLGDQVAGERHRRQDFATGEDLAVRSGP